MRVGLGLVSGRFEASIYNGSQDGISEEGTVAKLYICQVHAWCPNSI